MKYVSSHSAASRWSMVVRSMAFPMCCSSQFCSTIPKAKSDSSRPRRSGVVSVTGLQRLDFTSSAVVHSYEMKAALIVGDQEPGQVAGGLPENLENGICRVAGEGRVRLAVALDNVGNQETPHAHTLRRFTWKEYTMA